MIAALFVMKDGPYFGLPNVDPWDEARDARKYPGPHPVIAHPPCERWGRYWSGGPSAKVRREKGDDDDCFKSALVSLLAWGGVLEHPEASHAWSHFAIHRPPKTGGWVYCRSAPSGHLWTCCVEQGHYGHPARKATWLLYCGGAVPPELKWGASKGRRLDEGFHSREERRSARAAGKRPVKRLDKRECIETPTAFRDLLMALANGSRPESDGKYFSRAENGSD